MNKLKIYLAIWLMLFVLPLLSKAQDEDAPDKALAIRASRIDAIRQLVDIVQELRISDNLQVKDFLKEYSQAQPLLIAFLQDAQPVGQPDYLSDGSCEFTMAVTLNAIITWLQETYRTYPSQVVASAEEFEQIRHYASQKVFTVTGRGKIKNPNAASNFEGSNIWERVDSRGKLMAIRAARVDAYRNLAEIIKGIRISSRTTIRDFVTESDEIRSAFNEFICGIETVGNPKYRTDGVVEVTVQVELEQLIAELVDICRNLAEDTRWNAKMFEKMKISSGQKVIRATGVGVPATKYLKPDAKVETRHVPTHNTKPSSSQEEQLARPEWASRTLKVKGVGPAPESGDDSTKAEIMAKRIAKTNGYRQLEGIVMGFKVTAATSVFDLAKKYPRLESAIQETIKKARVKSYRTLDNRGIEAELELNLGEIWQVIQSYQKKYHSEE